MVCGYLRPACKSLTFNYFYLGEALVGLQKNDHAAVFALITIFITLTIIPASITITIVIVIVKKKVVLIYFICCQSGLKGQP